LGRLTDYLLGGTISLRGARRVARKLRFVHKAGRLVFKTLKGIARVGRRAFAFGMGKATIALASLTAAATLAIKSFADFQWSLAKVGTLLPDGTKAVEQFGASVQKMAIDTGQSTQLVADGLFQAISAGVDTGKAIGFMDTAGKAAVGGFTDMNVAVDGLTNVLNAYGHEIEETERVSDAFFTANKFGKTTFAELAQNIGTVAPMAAQMGASYQDLLAATISLTKAGVRTDAAMTQISAAMTMTLNASKKLSTAARKKLGLVFGPGAIKHYGGFVPFMKAVQETTGGNIKVLKDLFPNIRALRGVLRLTSETGLKEMTRGLQSMTDEAGITEKKFGEVSKTLVFQWRQAKQAFLSIVRGMGEGAVQGLGIDLTNITKIMAAKAPAFKQGAKDFFGAMKDGFKATIPGIKTAWVSAFESMGVASDTVTNALNSHMGKSGSRAKVWGKMIGITIGKLITGFGRLVSKLDTLAKGIVAALGAAQGAYRFMSGGRPAGTDDPLRGAKGAVFSVASARKALKARYPKASAKHLDAAAKSLNKGSLTGQDIQALRTGTRPTEPGLAGKWFAKTRNIGDILRANQIKKRYREGRVGGDERFTSGAGSLFGTPGAGGKGRIKPLQSPAESAISTATSAASAVQRLVTGMIQGHKALGSTVADAVKQVNWNVKIKNKTDINLNDDKKGGGATEHEERGAGDAIVEFRMRQKYLVTPGSIESVPLEFISVRGLGATLAGVAP
jgi:TP901 family phage tail tape measure protein